MELGEIKVRESPWLALWPLEEYPDMFFSFARLGGSMGPRVDSITRWVLKYGLPRQPDVHQTESEYKSYMFLEDFKKEARYAHRLLKLYAEIRGQEVGAIMARAKNPQSSLDEMIKAAFASTPHRVLSAAFGRLYYRADLNARARDEVALFTSLRILTDAVNEKAGHRPRLSAESASTVIETWYCPNLLSAMYLQLYLLIADRRPMSYCQFCGVPFPYRKSKFYCSSTCRSNARHERNA